MQTCHARRAARLPALAWTCAVAAALAVAGPSRAAEPAPAPPSVAPAAAAVAPGASVPAAAAVSLSARKLYEQAKSQLVQIRTLLKGRASQSSVGSGFVVSADGLIVTNYHVVADAALKPDRHDLVYVTTDGREGPLAIVEIDVRHDLALLRAADQPARTFDALPFRPADEPLAQGERIYSLGVPLDVGFAVVQGTYNGFVARSFLPQIFFGGAMSAGMSGGPALDEAGRIVGINVARRGDGESVSFLVPAAFAVALLEPNRSKPPLALPAWPRVAAELELHQAALVERFLAQGWKPATHPRYRVPVPPDVFMRCWGTTTVSRTGGLDFEKSECAMDTRIFVGDFTTGSIALRHESYDGTKLGPLRFAARYAQSFQNERFTRLSSQHQTKPRCSEDFVDREGLALRAVVCLRAYRKLPNLYDVSVLVATLDRAETGVQGRFDADGVSFANAQRLVKHYLDAFKWNAPQPP